MGGRVFIFVNMNYCVSVRITSRAGGIFGLFIKLLFGINLAY